MTNGLVTPVNQIVSPAGTQVELPRARPNALALSPDGRLLVTSGLTNKLVVVDPAAGKISQVVAFPPDKAQEEAPDSDENLNTNNTSQLSFTGLAFSPDGSRIYLANVNGDIKVFGVGVDETVSPLFSIALPLAKLVKRTNEIPAGIAVSRDGKKIYVAGNMSNHLFELDAATGNLLRTWNAGVAPYDVVLCKNKIYVSNWGGRRPDADSVTGPAGHGTLVRVDERSIASEGSVSVIDLTKVGGASVPASREPNGLSVASPHQQEILTGLHACAMALSPDKKFLVVANAGSDTLSVIDTRTDKIVDTICARQNPGDPFGAQPDALAFDKSGGKLFVCNGTQNAVAVFQFKSVEKILGLIPVSRFRPGESQLLGLIPVGWFPGAIAFDARRKQICVANIKNIGDKKEKPRKGLGNAPGFNSKQYNGSLSLVPVPSEKELAAFTQTALVKFALSAAGAGEIAAARKSNCHSPFPNARASRAFFSTSFTSSRKTALTTRCLGDVTNGNGDADLCVFGERVTPNEHKFVRDFVLAGQHLLLRRVERGRASMDGHGHRDGLHGARVRGISAQLSGGRRRVERQGRAGVFAGGLHLERRARARQNGRAISANSPRPLRIGKTRRARAKPKFLDYYHEFLNGTDELHYRQRAGHRGVAAVHRDEHGRLGSGHPGHFSRGAIHQVAETI